MPSFDIEGVAQISPLPLCHYRHILTAYVGNDPRVVGEIGDRDGDRHGVLIGRPEKSQSSMADPAQSSDCRPSDLHAKSWENGAGGQETAFGFPLI